MKRMVLLSYFDSKFGPRVFYSCPKKMLDVNLTKMMCGFMDFFGVKGYLIYVMKNRKIFNFPLEIQSNFGRGGVEMLSVSIITEREISRRGEEAIVRRFNGFKKNMQSKKNYYLAFYDARYKKTMKNEIQEAKIAVESLVNELYNKISR